MLTKAKAQELSASWHSGEWSALYHYSIQGDFQPQKSVRYLWEILQKLQNQYFLACPYSLSNEQQSQLKSLQEFFENEIRSCTYINIEYKKHPIYGYQYPDAVSGAGDIVGFETVKEPV